MAKMAAEPHHLGSPGSKAVAEWILSKFKSWGLNASIEEYRVLASSYPGAEAAVRYAQLLQSQGRADEAQKVADDTAGAIYRVVLGSGPASITRR